MLVSCSSPPLEDPGTTGTAGTRDPPDLRWAAAVAAFAEILKGSPFAERAALPVIDAIVAEQAARDDDRADFAQLYTRARNMLGSPR